MPRFVKAEKVKIGLKDKINLGAHGRNETMTLRDAFYYDIQKTLEVVKKNKMILLVDAKEFLLDANIYV